MISELDARLHPTQQASFVVSSEPEPELNLGFELGVLRLRERIREKELMGETE